MKKDIKVSVVTVCYNNPIELEDTVGSVIGQSYRNIEFIIIDGGSGEETLNVIKKYSTSLSKWISEPDDGIYHAMNKGLNAASGDWLIFMNAGDTFYNQQVVEDVVLSHSNECDIIFGKSISFFEDIQKVRYADFSLDDKHWFYRKMPNHQSIFMSKSVYKQNRFDTRFTFFADTFFLRNIFSNYRYHFIDRYICFFEIGGVSTYYKSFRNFKRILGESYKISGFSSTFLSHFIKFFFQLVMARPSYLRFYLKYIVKE